MKWKWTLKLSPFSKGTILFSDIAILVCWVKVKVKCDFIDLSCQFYFTRMKMMAKPSRQLYVTQVYTNLSVLILVFNMVLCFNEFYLFTTLEPIMFTGRKNTPFFAYNVYDEIYNWIWIAQSSSKFAVLFSFQNLLVNQTGVSTTERTAPQRIMGRIDLKPRLKVLLKLKNPAF